jgi:hypothetical protein
VTIIEDLQKIAPFGWIENRQSSVVEDEELNTAGGFEQAAIAAVAASEGERLEQARDAVILDRTIIAASLVAESASNPTFAEAGWPCDEQVLAAVDPVAADESGKDGTIDAARRARSARRAAAYACSAASVTNALSLELTRSMTARCASRTSIGLTARCAIRLANSRAERRVSVGSAISAVHSARSCQARGARLLAGPVHEAPLDHEEQQIEAVTEHAGSEDSRIHLRHIEQLLRLEHAVA